MCAVDVCAERAARSESARWILASGAMRVSGQHHIIRDKTVSRKIMAGRGVLSRKRDDTVGEPPSPEIRVSHMPAWKAKKPGKLTQEKSTSRTLKYIRQQ
jgi:hypothetical protein